MEKGGRDREKGGRGREIGKRGREIGNRGGGGGECRSGRASYFGVLWCFNYVTDPLLLSYPTRLPCPIGRRAVRQNMTLMPLAAKGDFGAGFWTCCGVL